MFLFMSIFCKFSESLILSSMHKQYTSKINLCELPESTYLVYACHPLLYKNEADKHLYNISIVMFGTSLRIKIIATHLWRRYHECIRILFVIGQLALLIGGKMLRVFLMEQWGMLVQTQRNDCSILLIVRVTFISGSF